MAAHDRKQSPEFYSILKIFNLSELQKARPGTNSHAVRFVTLQYGKPPLLSNFFNPKINPKKKKINPDKFWEPLTKRGMTTAHHHSNLPRKRDSNQLVRLAVASLPVVRAPSQNDV